MKKIKKSKNFYLKKKKKERFQIFFFENGFWEKKSKKSKI
jgi:hypothetical protein